MGLPDTSPVPKKDPMGMDYIPVYEGEEPRPRPAQSRSASTRCSCSASGPSPPRSASCGAVQAVGTIQANERLLYKVTSRFEGWIELHVNTTGQAVDAASR